MGGTKVIITADNLNNLETHLATPFVTGIAFIEWDNGELNCNYSQFKALLLNSLPMIRNIDSENNSWSEYSFVTGWNDEQQQVYTTNGAFSGYEDNNMWYLL